MANVTFIEQNSPIDEYGRAVLAVARSVLRAVLDSLSSEDLTDLNTPLEDVRMRQLSKVVRLDRDKGMRGDGFEWAVHEAVLGGEPRVTEMLGDVLHKASPFVKSSQPSSLLFGHERARYYGFLEAVIDGAGTDSYLLPQGSGRPYRFGHWVSVAARGQAAEAELTERIRHIWKTDIFLSAKGDPRYFAATIKSNYALLEGGRGLRIGIVPESADAGNAEGIRYNDQLGLWVVTLPDPNGFMGLFNDAYHAVARALLTLGKQPMPPYYTKPSAKATKLQLQLEKYPDARVNEVEAALNAAAQQNLVVAKHQLVSVNAPPWLRLKKMSPKIISPKPRFEPIE